MTATATRRDRIERLIRLLNRIHATRKALGRPTGHLLDRARRLTQAWLADRDTPTT